METWDNRRVTGLCYEEEEQYPSLLAQPFTATCFLTTAASLTRCKQPMSKRISSHYHHPASHIHTLEEVRS